MTPETETGDALASLLEQIETAAANGWEWATRAGRRSARTPASTSLAVVLALVRVALMERQGEQKAVATPANCEYCGRGRLATEAETERVR